MSNWLNLTFHNFDSAVFNAVNSLAKSAGGFFTPFFKFVSFFGEGGIFFILLSVALMLFKNTRKCGFTMLLALGIGALMTNVIIKNAVARPRPYTTDEFRHFWQAVGATSVSEFSFPSGHTTSTMAVMTALFLTANKKWSWFGFIVALLMGLSRIYLVVHYASDVVAGLLVGGICGTVAYFIVKYLFTILEKRSDKKFCAFILKADIINLFKKEKSE